VRRTLLFIFAFLCFTLSGTVVSCNKKAKKDFSAIEKKLRDSLDQTYKREELGYVYYDSIPLYKDKSEKELVDYIPFCDKIYIDTILEPLVDKETITYVGLTYVKSGKVKKAVTKQPNLARGMTQSRKDTSLIFMSNYLEPKGEFCAAEIIAVKNKKKIASFIPDDSLITGLYLDLFSVDSTTFKDIGDVIFLSTYYPACGYSTDDWYLTFMNNQFIVLSHTTSWADAPYWDNTTVYLPFKMGKTVTLGVWSPWYDYLVTDENGKIISCELPAEFAGDIDQMIYEESNQSYEILDAKGDPVMEDDMPMLSEELYRKRWLKWNGKEMVEVKLDTTSIKRPYNYD
jgi:hypothetical protein